MIYYKTEDPFYVDTSFTPCHLIKIPTNEPWCYFVYDNKNLKWVIYSRPVGHAFNLLNQEIGAKITEAEADNYIEKMKLLQL